MNIFLSYANEDRPVAATLNRALLEQGHDVFFDREDLPPGEEFHIRIRRAIERADLFVFLVSPHSIDPGSYTLSELAIVERAWKRVSGRVLPVMLSDLPFSQLPTLVRAVTVLTPAGDVAAAAADAVHRLHQAQRRTRWWRIGAGVLAVALVAGAIRFGLMARHDAEPVGEDGVPLILVPAGKFVMGDDEVSPRREAYLDAFYIDRYEVTTARYAKFLKATGDTAPPLAWEQVDLAQHGEHPVVGVDWHDAEGYCRWVGRRLPTSAEWEKAARGTDERVYPWGDSSPTLTLTNFSNSSPDFYDGLSPVGTHGPGRSPHGVDDMAGNAAEWVSDWWADGPYRFNPRNPRGPDSGYQRIIRGGGRFDGAANLVLARRFYALPDLRAADIGFRCAKDAPQRSN